MAEMYKNVKTGVVAELVEVNEKTKQVTLKKADGKFTASNKGIFEKNWKKIENADAKSEQKEAPKKVEDKQAEKKAEPKTEKKADEAPKAEKKATEKKPKAEKKEKVEAVKYDAKAFFDRAKKVVEDAGFTTKTYRGMDNFLCVFEDANKKSKVYEMNFTKFHFRVYTSQLRVPKDVEFKAMKNALNAGITFEYDEKSFEETIKTIISWKVAE